MDWALPEWHPGFGEIADPVMIGVYSDFGTGKTTDMLRACAYRGVVFAAPGATLVGAEHLGFTPQVVHVRDVGALIDGISELADLPTDDEIRPFVIGIDDLSPLFDQTAIDLHPGGSFSGDGAFLYYGELTRLGTKLRLICRQAGFHVLANGHPSMSSQSEDRKTKKIEVIKGGMRMPTAKNRRDMVGIFDTFLQGGVDEKRMIPGARRAVPAATVPGRAPKGPPEPEAPEGVERGEWFWGGTYKNAPQDADWYMKSRLACFQGVRPMNLAEGLRASGMPWPRMEGLEWQDEVADMVADDFAQGKHPIEVFRERVKELRSIGIADLHARWAVQDGRDRWAFRVARAARFNVD